MNYQNQENYLAVADSINIPENTYSIPTEIRKEVVQAICDHIIRLKKLDFSTKTKALYFDTKTHGISNDISNSNGTYVRVHSIEVNTAFQAIQRKGYFIKKEKETVCEKITYTLHYVDFDFNGSYIQWIEFDLCIDEK